MAEREHNPQLRRLLGEKIRSRRRALGLSQEAVAEKLGVSYQQVQKYEKGSSAFSVERLAQLAAVLAVSPAHFLEPSATPLRRTGRMTERNRPQGTLSKGERLFVALLRRVRRRSQRVAVLTLLKSMAER